MLIFLRANAAFGHIVFKLFTYLSKSNFPAVRGTLRRGATVFWDIAFFNIAKFLVDQIVSSFLFFA